MNDEGFTATNITTPRIGILRNNWRQRIVHVHAHPTDPEKVISIGFPLTHRAAERDGVVCVEPRWKFQAVLRMFPKVAIYD